MTVSSSSVASAATTSGASSALPASSAAAASPERAASALAAPDASTLRTFAVILCSDCLYLEFPGCDVHGALYAERMKDADGKMHAKCPVCTASTNNARPFRDGCRRCKAPTTVSMWVCSLQEVEQAMEAFPATTEEVEHTAIACERCQSVVFPRARDALTTRSTTEPLAAAGGKPLKVANFQLSMPHVDGCSRKGKPLQTIAVRLPKSELKFVIERIERCAVAPRLTGGPQYRPRQLELITQQDHMHQVAIRLLTVVINAFNADSPSAATPLRKVVEMLGKLEPLALFPDWSPPRQLSQALVQPKHVTSSSDFDKQHEAARYAAFPFALWGCFSTSLAEFMPPPLLNTLSRVLESGSEYWRSTSKVDGKPPRSEEWLVCQFASAVTLSGIVLRWQEEFVPSHFSVGISRDGMSYETVGIVVKRAVENRMLIPKSITCKEAAFDAVHTSTGALLQNIQQWLLTAAVSSLSAVRELALQALQKLLLASGSLCGLLQFAACLVLNAPVEDTTFSSLDWDEVDLLSEDAQLSAQQFLTGLAKVIQRIVVGNGRLQAEEVDKCVLEQTSLMLQEEALGNIHPVANTTSVEADSDRCATVEASGKDAERTHSSVCLVTFLVGQQKFLRSIKRRSQKAEEFTGKRELELTQLEEPFSIEICPEFFAVSHRMLTRVLARWLPGKQQQSLKFGNEEEETKWDGTASNGSHGSVDVYDALTRSFGQFGVSEGGQETDRSDESRSALLSSPDGLCVAVLQIITSNLRRLVLSRIDPSDIGITPAPIINDDDLLSAPPALEPLVSSLEQLVSLGTKRSDKFFPVSLKAAAAMEVGMEAFYPSAHQRTKVLASRMGKGATLEVQVRWPVQERDQEDPRYERLILMLQFECIKLGVRHAIRGSWFFFMHLVVEVPPARDTEEVLTKHFAPCIQRAGFSSWQVAAGAQELSINLERHLHWNRVEKMSHDSGAGWIRVYPADVAAYDEVQADVEAFLEEHGKQESSSVRP
ncbi:hypothetical protein BBJ28_00003365 [Nothophytophthora sp. Chile5]|nr:hypothetical protein BBJ28_00003365 [Nothophytophthora sp. Chile5]